MTGATPMVRGRGVVRRFGDRTALDGLDVEIPAATCTAVFGKNGSGKTTLLRLCAGLGRPDGGTLEVAGRTLPKASRDVRAAVGLVLDEPLLPLSLTLREASRYIAGLTRVDESGVWALVDRFGLSHRGRDALSTFSRGMRQRVALVHALAGDPELLLLDEPMNGLDPAGRDLVREVVRDRTRRGRSTIAVLHDVAAGLEMSTHSVLIENGRTRVQEASVGADAGELERRLS